MRELLKKAALSMLLLGLMAVLLWQNGVVGQAVRQGLLLCGRSVIPSLFPFFVTVSFAVACGFLPFCGSWASRRAPPCSCWASWAAIP